MNYYVTLEHFLDLDAVTIYTARLEEMNGDRHELSEFEKFMEGFHHDPSVTDEYGIIMESIMIMGEYGAEMDMLRQENRAVALPPPGRQLGVMGYERRDFVQLRLYMMRISDAILVVFNGGIKTKPKAQNCPNVSHHFRTANTICEKIDKGIRAGDIRINGKRLDMYFDEPFII